MSEFTMTRRMRIARGVAFASLVIAIIMILSCVFACYECAAAVGQVADDPTISISIDPNSTFGQAITGSGATANEATIALLAVLAMFFGFGAILNIFPLLSSITTIRAAKRPNDKQSTYILAVIGAGVAFLTMNPVNCILLVIAAWQLQHDFVETVGEKVAYKDGKRLGFMRFMEIVCVFDLLATVALLIFVTKSDYGVYNAAFWVGFVKLIMEAVALWFIWNRKQHGREVIMIMVAAYVVIYAIVSVVSGDAVVSFNFLTTSIVPILMLVYFGFAPRPRAIFTEPFKTESREKQLREDEKLWNPKSWRFWRNLLLYFCIFSVIGHWMEWSVCWIIRIACENGITFLGTYDPNSGIWSNMLNPFFVYGMALVLIGILLFPMRNLFFRKISNKWGALAVEFVFNFILIAILELVIGLTQNLDYSLWDYRTMPLNFMGQICITNTTFFTIMATVFTNIVYPNLEKYFAKIPDDVMNVLTVVVLVFFVLVVSMYVVNLPGVNVSSAFS